MSDWHQKSILDGVAQLDADAASGLADEQVTACRAEYGPNELVETGGRGPWRILWEQLCGAMVLMLTIVFWAVEAQKLLFRRGEIR